MPIQCISRMEFDKRGPQRLSTVAIFVKERAWYADIAGNFLGLITQDNFDHDWGYVVLARDPNGKFRAIDCEASIEAEDAATAKLFQVMEKYIVSGQTVFIQDEPGA